MLISCNFVFCNFVSCHLVRHFYVRHFQHPNVQFSTRNHVSLEGPRGAARRLLLDGLKPVVALSSVSSCVHAVTVSGSVGDACDKGNCDAAIWGGKCETGKCRYSTRNAGLEVENAGLEYAEKRALRLCWLSYAC